MASGRRNGFVVGLERIQAVSQAANAEVPAELIDRYIDQARSPDEFSAEVLHRATATSNHTRGKIAALHHLRESVQKLSEQHDLLDEHAGNPEPAKKRAKS